MTGVVALYLRLQWVSLTQLLDQISICLMIAASDGLPDLRRRNQSLSIIAIGSETRAAKC